MLIALVLAQGNARRSSRQHGQPSADGNLFVETKLPKIFKRYIYIDVNFLIIHLSYLSFIIDIYFYMYVFLSKSIYVS